ncbi:MAG: DNA-processing protein DprA [Luteibaculum sp.]
MKTQYSNAQIILALRKYPNVGFTTGRKLLSAVNYDAQRLVDLNLADFEETEGISAKFLEEWNLLPYLEQAEEQLEQARANGDLILTIADEKYPQKLKHLPDAPFALFVRGNVEALNLNKSIAVVGTRNITDYGKQVCQKLCAELVASGIGIISGLAFGVDAWAHHTTLQNGGLTGAVLGHGLQLIYPYQNKKLAQRIIDHGGFVLSEYDYGTAPDRQNFPTRNRIVAGMTDATLVIETGIKGGSMVTASFAQQYNKDVFVVPGRITDEYSLGCLELLKHDLARPVSSVGDILDEMAWKKMEPNSPRQLSMIIPDKFKSVYHQLEKPVNIDDLCVKSGKKLSELNALLIEMELEGWVQILPGKKVARM